MSAPELKKHANGVHYIHWTEGRRSLRVSTRQRDDSAAQVFLANWLLLKHNGPTAPAGEFKVRELWAVYCKKHPVAAEDTREWAWKNLGVHFGDLLPEQINQDVVDEYVRLRKLGKTGRPSTSSTIRRELVSLRSGLNWCASPKRKLIAKESLPAYDLPPEGEARDRWLRTEEIQRLLDAAAEIRRRYLGREDRLSRGERFLWLALETAARKGAILDLTWDRVDFEAGFIDYDVPGRVKTKKRRSKPPISKALRPILERAYEERVSDYVLDNQAPVDKIVWRIAERAKVAGVSPHVLRHTAATHMARSGVPLWKIAGILGNTTAMVENVYAKHSPEGLADAVDMISAGKLEAAE